MAKQKAIIDIPPAFWDTVGEEEFLGIILANGLNAEQCARLFRLTDRQGKAPDFAMVIVDGEQVKRAFPAKRRSSSRAIQGRGKKGRQENV